MKTLVHAVSCISFLAVAAMAADLGGDVPQAPVPAQILSARKVFIAYSGAENLNLPLMTVFSGKSDRVYNEFYALMKEWGRYELVGAPADADLVFEIGQEFTGLRAPEVGRMRLDIRDPRSNVLLWSLHEYVRSALFQGHRDKNLDQAMAVIVDSVKDLVAPPAGGPTPQGRVAD
jgi:hypothetical protein